MVEVSGRESKMCSLEHVKNVPVSQLAPLLLTDHFFFGGGGGSEVEGVIGLLKAYQIQFRTRKQATSVTVKMLHQQGNERCKRVELLLSPPLRSPQ